MELKICILLLVVGNLLVIEGLKSHRLRSNQVFDEETARKLNAQYEKLIDDAWVRSTVTEGDDCTPYFFSKTYNSTIIGKYMYTFYNRKIYAFQGFRYAEAERFMPPTPVDKFWDDSYFVADHIGFKCPQSAFIGNDPSGNEDCLFLNVYTPYNPEDMKTQKLPVMLFIHGGGFIGGDASYYLPTRLLDHDVILITIHYRLGAFGFFTLNTPEAPGNMALYDQVAALNWTQTYISDFGGDPDKVTIFGESAGSVSVNYMMFVPPAIGMFRAVIAESGSCLDHWGIDLVPEEAALHNAEFVGCYEAESDEIDLDCMKNVPTADLVNAQDHLVMSDRNNGLLGFRGAAPTIQTFDIDDADFPLIFTKLPKEYFMENDFEKVPFMTGANKQEGSYVAGIMYKDFLQVNNLTNNATYLREQMIQDILHGIGVEDDTHSLATSLQMLYCPDIDLASNNSFPCLIDMLGALFLKGGSWEVCNYHSYFSNESTYYYSFEFESDDSLFKILIGSVPFDGGITHSDELQYLFPFPAVMDPGLQVTTVDRLTLMWTNFATYLDPTPESQMANLTALGIPIWTPYKFEDHHVLVIADDLFVDQEYSDRWTITMDEIRAEQVIEGSTTTTEATCTGNCADYKDQRDTYEAVMITFIVLFVVIVLVAAYFFFKARR